MFRHRMIRRRVLSGPVGLIALLVATAPVAAGGGWTPPEPFMDDAGSPFIGRPAIVFQDGVLYVAAAVGAPAPGIRLFTIDATGSTIHHVTSSRDRQPAIAIGDNGTLHLAFSRRGTGCGTPPCTAGIVHARSIDGGDTWTVDRVHKGDHDVHPSISLDPEGKPWIYLRAGNRILETHRVQGHWSGFALDSGCCGPDPLAGPEVKVADGQGATASRRDAPRLSPAGLSPWTRLAVYRQNFDGGRLVMMLSQSDFSEQFLITDADDAFDPNIALDASQEVHIAYRRVGHGLWYGELNDQGNFVRTQIATAEIVGEPAIAALPGDHVIVVAATANRLIYRTNATGPWTGGSIPMSGPGPGLPGLATTPAGAARVVFVQDADMTRLLLTRHPNSW